MGVRWSSRGFRGRRVRPPIFRMHHFQSLRPAARLAEASYAHAPRQAVLLLPGEIEEPQREKARSVGNLAEHLPPAAEGDLGEQDLAFHGSALARQQFAQGNDARPILIAQRQEEQQILCSLHAQGAQPQGEGLADAAQYGDRLELYHKATMHSTSTCAPRGSAATPTAARAG